MSAIPSNMHHRAQVVTDQLPQEDHDTSFTQLTHQSRQRYENDDITEEDVRSCVVLSNTNIQNPCRGRIMRDLAILNRGNAKLSQRFKIV